MIYQMSKLTSYMRRRHRKRLLLHGHKPSSSVGLEIGPLDKPIVRKNEGRIFYVDIASASSLKEHYRESAVTNVDNICPVDFVWNDKPLRHSIPADLTFDYVIASHVIEHTANMIGWLKEIASVVRPGGILSLAVPDKRFTFDRDRELTTIEQVLTDHTVPRIHTNNPENHNYVFTSDTFAEIVAALCSTGK